MNLAAIQQGAARDALAVMGTCPVEAGDNLPPGTLVMLGPKEPGFWAHVSDAPEFADGAPDPLDRWSARVIGALAKSLGGTALFPFGDPPRPFIGWALRTGRVWSSPVGLLVHDTAGLLVSFRGAIHLTTALPFEGGQSPCDTCTAKPCLTACPVGALSGGGYDLATCHDYLDTPQGAPCMSGGCLVRRACPVSQRYARDPAQNAFHMDAFHPKRHPT